MTENRKKRVLKVFPICVAALLVIAILLVAAFCAIMSQAAWLRVHEPRPYKYPDSSWVSDDPEICIVNEGSDRGMRGYALSENTKYEFEFSSDNGSVVWFYDAGCIDEGRVIGEEDILLQGYCKYSEDKMVIKVKQDNLFGGAYKKITLYRVDITDGDS